MIKTVFWSILHARFTFRSHRMRCVALRTCVALKTHDAAPQPVWTNL